MHGTFFKIVAKPGKRDELVEFLRWDAEVARVSEPETMRFDVWQVPGDAEAFFVYEAYANKASFEKHQANEPYKKYVGYIEPQVLVPEGRRDFFSSVESFVTNDDLVFIASSQRQAAAEAARPDVTALSFGSFPPDPGSLQHFDGYAEMRRLTLARNAAVAHVHFPPESRTYWHRHEGEQLLWFIEGEGRIGTRDSECKNLKTITCSMGYIARIPAGLSHWHGASRDSAATHIAITAGTTHWDERVLECS
jgi:quercetin dioxygenase-like cupin family protein/quinol monooxygenase YgiN